MGISRCEAQGEYQSDVRYKDKLARCRRYFKKRKCYIFD